MGALELYRREKGTGAPVLFVIGMDADHSGWARVVPAIAPERRCISIDNRDAGRSPRARGPYGLDDMVEDTVRALDDAGVARADVVGQSLGGAIAVRLAALHPDRVGRLVLVSTAARMGPRARALLASWVPLRRDLDIADYYAAVFPWLYSPAQYAQPEFVEAALRAVAQRGSHQEHDAFCRHVDVVTTWDVRHDLEAVRAPALVVAGADDLVTTPDDARVLADGLPDARMLLVPDAGHSAVFTHADVVADAIRGFLGARENGRR